jgi:predicted amidohydrolase
MSADLSFTAAMVQMCTGLLPPANLEQGTRLIREAAAQGADYVLTPEVSNMIQSNRQAMFENLALESLSRAGGRVEDSPPHRLAGIARLP